MMNIFRVTLIPEFVLICVYIKAQSFFYIKFSCDGRQRFLFVTICLVCVIIFSFLVSLVFAHPLAFTLKPPPHSASTLQLF